tara:strand:- start:581 stop:904 length:324 start_codon:yes stop_codon:yes gene_type:complete
MNNYQRAYESIAIVLNNRKVIPNQAMERVETCWKIGEILDEREKSSNKPRVNQETLAKLADELTTEFGSGFTQLNLTAMRRLYRWSRYELEKKRFSCAYHLRLCRIR